MKLFKTKCEKLGHDWKKYAWPTKPYPKGIAAPLAGGEICSRCNKITNLWGQLEMAATYGGLREVTTNV
jgi:hypothetical protein